MKNAFASRLAAAACALALVASPAVALAQPVTTESAPVSPRATTPPTTTRRPATRRSTSSGYEDWEVCLTTLDTYHDRDGFLADHVGLNAHGIHYDFEVDYYDASFYSWSCYVL